jgi:serine/threonine-protein kinase RsbW
MPPAEIQQRQSADELVVRRSGRRMELMMTSHPSILRPARLALEGFARESGMEQESAEKIGLVLNEALANVMRHGYDGAAEKPIVVTFDRHGEGDEAEIEVTIRDWGKPFDPGELPTAPPPDPDRIMPGGLGLLCMRQMMDKVTFTRLADGMLLTMVKKVGKVGASS